MRRVKPTLLRRLFNIAAAVSLVVLLATSALWLVHLVRNEFHFGLNERLHLGKQLTFHMGRSADGMGWAGYALDVERPSPTVRGPKYLTPEYMRWEKQFHQRDWFVEFAGFRCWRWALITSGGPPSVNHTEFHGDQYALEVPFWFVCAASAPVPGVWLRRHLQVRRRARDGRCQICGYDLRATPGRCPECGAVAESVHCGAATATRTRNS